MQHPAGVWGQSPLPLSKNLFSKTLNKPKKMTDNSNIKNEPLQLNLFGMPEPVDIDDSAEHEYYAKGKFIEQQRFVDFPDISRVYLPDFIAEIFERPLGDLRAVEPFEERQGERYLKWREEENAGKEHD